MLKIEKVLSDLGIGNEDESLHADFKVELKAFLELPVKTNEADEILVESFYKLHDIESDPEILEANRIAEEKTKAAEKSELGKTEAETKAEEARIKTEEAEEKARLSEEKSQKAEEKAEAEKLQKEEAIKEAKIVRDRLAEIDAKDALTEADKIALLENKRSLDYNDLRKIGITNPENEGVYIEVKGYKLRKRYFYLEYAVKSKPLVKE
jgi:hypothetical protein